MQGRGPACNTGDLPTCDRSWFSWWLEYFRQNVHASGVSPDPEASPALYVGPTRAGICDNTIPIECATEAHTIGCATKWSQLCPGVDNPGGAEHNDTPLSELCTAECGGGHGSGSGQGSGAGSGTQGGGPPYEANLRALANEAAHAQGGRHQPPGSAFAHVVQPGHAQSPSNAPASSSSLSPPEEAKLDEPRT